MGQPSSKNTSSQSLDQNDSAHSGGKDYLEIVLHRKWLIAGVGSAAVVLAVLWHFWSPSFSAKSYLLVDSDQENAGFNALLGSLGVMGEQVAALESENEKNLLLLQSSSFHRKWATDVLASPLLEANRPELLRMGKGAFDLLKKDVDVLSPNYLSRMLRDSTKVHSKNKGILEITVATPNRELTVFLSNTLLETAVSMFSTREEKKLEGSLSYIKRKIEETVSKMEEVDKRIINLTTKNASLSLLAPQTAVGEKILTLKTDIGKLEMVYEQNRKMVDALKQKLAPADGSPLNLAGQQRDALYGLEKTISNLGIENQMLKTRIDSMKLGLQTALKSNLSLPKEEQALSDLKRQKGLDYFVFDNLFKTQLQLEVRGLSLLNRVYPLQKVSLTDVSVSAHLLPKVFLSFILACILSSILAYTWQGMYPLIRRASDLGPTGLSFIGTIPEVSKEYLEQQGDRGQLCDFDIDSKETVSFRQIRSRIIHLANHSGTVPRSIITLLSFGSAEGKTFASANLASSFAHMGKRVLIVDFDLRRASVSKLFGLHPSKGLCDYLESGIALDQIIVRNIRPCLDIIPAGVMLSQITERLTNQKVIQLLGQLKPNYDYIVIDTAPILVAHESLLLAKETDFAILMTTAWKTKLEHVHEAARDIRSVRKTHVHCLLNRGDTKSVSLASNYYVMQGSRKSDLREKSV